MNRKKICAALALVLVPPVLAGCTVESASGSIGKAMTDRALTVQGVQGIIADNVNMRWYGINPADTNEMGTVGEVVDYFKAHEQLPQVYLDSIYMNADINGYNVASEVVDGEIVDYVCNSGGAQTVTRNITKSLSGGFDLTTGSSVRELEEVLISNGAYGQEYYPEGDGPVEPHMYMTYVAATHCPRELGIMPWQLINEQAVAAEKKAN